MSANKKSEQEFLKELSKEGRNICAKLTKHGKSRKWLADQIEISSVALNYKLKGKVGFFTKSEEIAIKSILDSLK